MINLKTIDMFVSNDLNTYIVNWINDLQDITSWILRTPMNPEINWFNNSLELILQGGRDIFEWPRLFLTTYQYR